MREEIGVDFLKCDVEGAELKVFQGGLATITSDKPIVFSEILRKWSRKLGYNPNEIFSFFYDLQYRAFTAVDRDSSRLNSRARELGATDKGNKLEEVIKKRGGKAACCKVSIPWMIQLHILISSFSMKISTET